MTADDAGGDPALLEFVKALHYLGLPVHDFPCIDPDFFRQAVYPVSKRLKHGSLKAAHGLIRGPLRKRRQRLQRKIGMAGIRSQRQMQLGRALAQDSNRFPIMADHFRYHRRDVVIDQLHEVNG